MGKSSVDIICGGKVIYYVMGFEDVVIMFIYAYTN